MLWYKEGSPDTRPIQHVKHGTDVLTKQFGSVISVLSLTRRTRWGFGGGATALEIPLLVGQVRRRPAGAQPPHLAHKQRIVEGLCPSTCLSTPTA